MLVELLVKIAKDNSITKESKSIQELRDFIGVKGKDIYLSQSVEWVDIEFEDRMKILKNYVKEMINHIDQYELNIKY